MNYNKFVTSSYLVNYIEFYCSPESETFGNAYQSAIKAGYKPSYARVITVYYNKLRLPELIKLSGPWKAIFDYLKVNDPDTSTDPTVISNFKDYEKEKEKYEKERERYEKLNEQIELLLKRL